MKVPPLDHAFSLHRDLTLTDKQLRDRIRERFLESSIIRAVRDVIGYILFMAIIIMVFRETSVNFFGRFRPFVFVQIAECRNSFNDATIHFTITSSRESLPEHRSDAGNDGSSHMENYSLGFLRSQEWIRRVIENRLFLDHQHYSCEKKTCNYVPIRRYSFLRSHHRWSLPCLADSPLYLSKSIRIRQIRVERKQCHPRITQLFPSSLSPSCFVGGNNLIKGQSYVIGGQRHCSSWQLAVSNKNCSDVCNYSTVWSALAYKQRTRLYLTRESPWYFLFHLLPEETVGRDEISCLMRSCRLLSKDWTVQSETKVLRFE